VDDGTEAVGLEERADQVLVAYFADDQFDAGIDDGLVMAEDEIVEDDDLAALGSEEADGVRADVSGSTSDKDRGLVGIHE